MSQRVFTLLPTDLSPHPTQMSSNASTRLGLSLEVASGLAPSLAHLIRLLTPLPTPSRFIPTASAPIPEASAQLVHFLTSLLPLISSSFQ